MSISPCWKRAASAPGEGAMAPTLGNSRLIASNAGSMLVSEPPFILAIGDDRRIAVRMPKRFRDIGEVLRPIARKLLQDARLDGGNQGTLIEQHHVEGRRVARGLDFADLIDVEQWREGHATARVFGQSGTDD